MESVHLTRDGEVAIVRLEHKKASALDVELCHAIDGVLRDVARSDAKALVVTGTGAIFSAGVDLLRVLDGGEAYVRLFLPALDECLLRLFAFEKPTVAALNGHAIAGGAIVALACDHRILARGAARFAVPELEVGVPFPPLALEIVRAAVGHQTFDALVLGARAFQPDECLKRGCVHELCEPAELLPRALAAASRLSAVPPASYALHKRLVRDPILRHLERNAEQRAQEVLECWEAEGTLAAIRAYVARTLRK